MVPMDQPKVALSMLQSFIMNDITKTQMGEIDSVVDNVIENEQITFVQ